MKRKKITYEKYLRLVESYRKTGSKNGIAYTFIRSFPELNLDLDFLSRISLDDEKDKDFILARYVEIEDAD